MKLIFSLFILLIFSACGSSSQRNESFTAGSYSCDQTNPDNICLAIKYVAYQNPEPVINQTQVESDIAGLNLAWRSCHISFTLDKYERLNPDEYGLRFNPSNMSELDTARAVFDEKLSLLLIATGKWDRTGNLGDTQANAWTELPQLNAYLYGTVLESPVRYNTFLLAHEIGHYLGLSHVNDQTNVMNPIVYNKSKFDQSQCLSARATAEKFWTRVYR